MPRPFRFGVQLASLPADGWKERVHRIEALGYSSVFFPDHFGPQWEPVAALAAVAAVTTRLRVGSLVYDVDYRHPVVLAKASATTHLISGGRHEFGLGAGWMESDYREAGMVYDRPGLRIERMEEALQIIRAMWSQERTSFEGRHYQIQEIARAVKLPAGEQPQILVGGGGRKVLSVAGRFADIVGINPSMPEGRVTRNTAADLAPERVREKVGWVREAAEAAGRDPDSIELNSLVFVVALTDDPTGIRDALAGQSGMSREQVADCPLFLTGSASEIRERLEKRREQTGISYVVIQGDDPDRLERFAEGVVGPLSG
ncbi:MAG: TIGR03621 family F420-dependent LLM class oxidoreductase [Myxococcota bacterium]